MTDKMDLTVKMNPDKKDLYDSFAQALRGDDKLAPFFTHSRCVRKLK